MKIINDLYISKEVDYIMSNVSKEHRDDLKHWAFEKILKMDKTRIIVMGYDNLLNYFKRIIWVQWKSNNKKNKKGYWSEYEELETIPGDFNIISEEEDDNDYEERARKLIENKEYLQNILNTFLNINTNSVNYFFNRTVFELYYFDKMTLMQISKETDIGYETIRKSIKFTLEYVKEHIKRELKN